MFKQLFRLTVVTYVWKRYKAIIISTVILFVFFWLVNQLHQDYLSYGNLNENKEYIGLSFVIKWLAFSVGCIVYLLFNSWRKWQKKPAKDLPQEKLSKADLTERSADDQTSYHDPFDEIRKRNKLRSKADFIIEKHTD